MKTYYVEDKNGKFASADGSRRYTRLEGKAAYDFLKSPMGQDRRFMKLVSVEGDEDEINIEVRGSEMKAVRTYERREQYVADNARENPYTIISLSYAECDDDEYPEESLADMDVNVEDEVFRQIELETLRRALNSLTEDEYALIYALYLQDQPMTLQQYASLIGVHFTTVDYRRKCIFKRIKTFF